MTEVIIIIIISSSSIQQFSEVLFLRRSNVKVVDVEARCRHSSERRGDGEEGHSQGVVTACITCCHQEHCRPNHPYRNNTTVK